jgi:hypothetical protein
MHAHAATHTVNIPGTLDHQALHCTLWNASALEAHNAALLTTPVPAAPPVLLRSSNPLACSAVLFETADLNADVRDAADSYRDPAIATPQDKVAGAHLCLRSPTHNYARTTAYCSLTVDWDQALLPPLHYMLLCEYLPFPLLCLLTVPFSTPLPSCRQAVQWQRVHA